MSRVAELGDHARDRAADVVHGLAESGRKRYDEQQKRASRNVRKLERKLERASKRLPVDTPLDKRRRRRNVQRAEAGGGLGVVVALVAGAVGYLVWRARRLAQWADAETSRASATATRSESNGERSPELSSRSTR